MEFLGYERNRMIAHNPATNRLIERFHGQLKASLMAKNSINDRLEHLLGIHTTIKSDLDAYSAGLLHGSPLGHPDEFLALSSNPDHPAVTISFNAHVNK